MSEHTPGPWKLDLRSGCLAVYPASEDHNCLGETNRWAIHYAKGYPIVRGDGLPAWDIEPEKVANGRLIAAAPDLLAACKAALHYIATTGPDDDTSPPIQEQRIMEALEAAIAKAEVTA